MSRAIQAKLLVLSILIIPLLSAPGADAQEGAGSSQDRVFVAQAAMREVTLTGYTRARHVMDVVSEEAGRCTRVEADVGDTISEEGIFCILDTTFIDLAIEKNRVDQRRVENRIAYEIKEMRRFEELVERDSAAQSTLDGHQNRLDQSEFELQALKIEEANLKERRARHVIRVPLQWTMTERSVEPGEWVSVGKFIGKAGDFQTLLVPFSLSPDEYSALKRLDGGPELRFPDEGGGGITLRAQVERISPAFDPKTRKINIDLAVRKGLPNMRGGLRAELTLEIPDRSGAVLVPTAAVSERYEEFWLTRENGQQVRVVLLDHGPQNTSRVRSPEVRPGDRFRAGRNTEP